MITNTGLTWVRDRIAGSSNDITHIGVGTGTTAAVAGDTTLGTEVYPDTVDRNAATGSSPSAYKRRYTMTLAVGDANGSTLTEVGAFTAATAGTMPLRQVHTGIAKTIAISVKYQIDVTIGRA
jgi:hypothetical protein